MNNFLWKLNPAQSWSATDAVVDSCEWVKAHDRVGDSAGHYQVGFTYRTHNSDEIHRGEFCHEGIRHITPYAVGEHLTIHYDPKKPGRYRFSGVKANHEALEAIVVVTVFALLAGYFLYAF